MRIDEITDVSVPSVLPTNIIDIEMEKNIDKHQVAEHHKKTGRSRYHRPLFIRLLALNRPEWIYIILGTFASVLTGATEPVVGIIFSSIYHQYSNANLTDQALITRNLALIIFALHVGGGLFVWIATWAFAVSGERLTRRMRHIGFSAMLRQEMGWFDREENSVSVLTTRLSADASALKVSMSRFISYGSSFSALNNFLYFFRTINVYYKSSVRYTHIFLRLF